MRITFITTGGTIDKNYEEKAGTYNFTIGEPTVKKVLDRIKPSFNYEIFSILKKDSLDMTWRDRNHIYNFVKDLGSTRIIITHGTDTMIETAKKLNRIREKCIVIVGSSRPLLFQGSDAPINIGVAIGAINVLRDGTHIAMNGRVYPWNKCFKEKLTGQFKGKNTSTKF